MGKKKYNKVSNHFKNFIYKFIENITFKTYIFSFDIFGVHLCVIIIIMHKLCNYLATILIETVSHKFILNIVTSVDSNIFLKIKIKCADRKNFFLSQKLEIDTNKFWVTAPFDLF